MPVSGAKGLVGPPPTSREGVKPKGVARGTGSEKDELTEEKGLRHGCGEGQWPWRKRCSVLWHL